MTSLRTFYSRFTTFLIQCDWGGLLAMQKAWALEGCNGSVGNAGNVLDSWSAVLRAVPGGTLWGNSPCEDLLSGENRADDERSRVDQTEAGKNVARPGGLMRRQLKTTAFGFSRLDKPKAAKERLGCFPCTLNDAEIRPKAPSVR